MLEISGFLQYNKALKSNYQIMAKYIDLDCEWMVDKIPKSSKFENNKEGIVFCKDIPGVIQGSIEINDLNAEIQNQVNHVAELKDDRLCALVADLLVENAMTIIFHNLCLSTNKNYLVKRTLLFL